MGSELQTEVGAHTSKDLVNVYNNDVVDNERAYVLADIYCISSEYSLAYSISLMGALFRIPERQDMNCKEKTPLKCNCIKLTLLVYFLISSRLCSGTSQLGPWTDWSVCQCAHDGTEGFTVRFRKPVPGSGIAYKCHLKDGECTQFEPCSCTVKKYAVDIRDDHRNYTSQIPADHGTPNESVVYSIVDRVRKKRNAFYNNYEHNDDYGNDNYQGHINAGHRFGSFQSNRNEYQPWNAGQSNPWESRRQSSHRNTHVDHNENNGHDNQDYGDLNTGFTGEDVRNYYDQNQYSATNRDSRINPNAYRTNVHMTRTGSGWNGIQGSTGGRIGHYNYRQMGQRNYQNEQPNDSHGQLPDIHYQRNDGYYGDESDAYVAHDVDSDAIPEQTVVRLQSSQQQILEEIRKLNDRLLQSSGVMAHFTDEIEHLEELEEARQGGGFSK